MPRPAITWLLPDTHFYHDKMITSWKIRPANFNELIMSNLKRLIAPQDLMIHLGDVIFYKYQTLKELLDSVPCRKILTLGNHDRRSCNWYMNNGFDFVVDSFVLNGIAFSHKPMKVLPDGCRINIHGHFHNTDHCREEPQYNDWYDTKIHRLVALEYTNYAPVDLATFVSKTDSGAVPFGAARTSSGSDKCDTSPR